MNGCVPNWRAFKQIAVADFERQTHIKVVYRLYDSNQTLEAKMLAGQSGYDIVSTTTAFYGRQMKARIAWSSDYSVAQARALEDGTGAHLAFILPKEGSNITYNAFLIPASAPHPKAAHKFLNFVLDPKVIAEITNDIHYGRVYHQY